MKKTNKKILGILGLIIVFAMTVFAYTLPEPEGEIVSNKIEIASLEK